MRGAPWWLVIAGSTAAPPPPAFGFTGFGRLQEVHLLQAQGEKTGVK